MSLTERKQMKKKYNCPVCEKLNVMTVDKRGRQYYSCKYGSNEQNRGCGYEARQPVVNNMQLNWFDKQINIKGMGITGDNATVTKGITAERAKVTINNISKCDKDKKNNDNSWNDWL